ncbi:hypothetical protein HDA32_002596 [Spinactinospora alkalitolerans]|uniref:Uncharacterized protein n=1 Tax=Spinactinospora alkalitolerans TaxID=687207 RepID=A0A852TSS6_9ACTN|nr:hypothetical protein [Spinactinospora alkalitolerans]NYE47476.1 hypothetical protein [Spinactinospora alkalitolerans]
MDFAVVTYATYLLISIGLTVWVARTLSRNGRIFLAEVFKGNEEFAMSVNHLLVVGFYLVNLGFIAFHMRLGVDITVVRGIFDALSAKIGTVLLVLGILHFANMYTLSRVRRRAVLDREEHPPVPPAGWTEPAVPQTREQR